MSNENYRRIINEVNRQSEKARYPLIAALAASFIVALNAFILPEHRGDVSLVPALLSIGSLFKYAYHANNVIVNSERLNLKAPIAGIQKLVSI